MDAVHKRNEEESSFSPPPRREDITDTMIFSPSDLVTMICRDVDLNFATRGTNTWCTWWKMGDAGNTWCKFFMCSLHN